MIDFDAGEKTILRVRRHKLALVVEASFLLFFVFLPPLLYWLAGESINLDLSLFLAVYSGVLLVAWMIFFVLWTDYYLDVLLVTDKRIIDVEQRGFFHREISTVRLENIQDITVNVSGMVATLLDYGTIRIQTAAESREFIIRDVPEPNKVKSVIYNLHNDQLEAPQPVRMIQ